MLCRALAVPLTRRASAPSRAAAPTPLRALSWHPHGAFIAAGAADGHLFLLAAASLDTLCTRREHAAPVTSLSFSPCGRYLAAGGGDGVIDVFELQGGELMRFSASRGHVCAIAALDWATDSALLQSNGADGTLCFWDMPSCARCAAAADARNADWHTHTCATSWATQGVLPCLSAQAAPVSACDRARARTCVAVGDAHGLVSLYQYPAHAGARRRIFAAHAGRVNALRFLIDDTFLVSGADDGSLFIWNVVL